MIAPPVASVVMGRTTTSAELERARLRVRNRRAHALWTLAVEPKAGLEVGKTREMAMAFFDAVVPLRQ